MQTPGTQPYSATVETPRGKVTVTTDQAQREVLIRHALLPFPLRFPFACASDLALAVAEAANVAAGTQP
jgi:hypothetical protein